MAEKRDYYEVLGVSKDVNADDLKKAYRRLAKKYHPDTTTEPKDVAEEKFKEISEAYDVLSNPDKRSRYDQYGFAGVDGSYGAGGFNMDDFAQAHGGDFEDIFGGIFGDIFGGSRRRQNPTGPREGDDLRYDLEIDLLDVLKGKESSISVRHTVACTECNGTGGKGGKTQTCSNCNGQGQVQRIQRSMFGNMVSVSECPRCHGSGRIPVETCPRCNGNGRLNRESKVSIKIPAGVEDGMRLRVAGAGDAGYNGGPSGDLYVFMHVKNHKIFERDGKDLHMVAEATYPKLVLGGPLTVTNLEGQSIEINVPAGTQVGNMLKVSGQGLPSVNSSVRGNLYVHVGITIPKKVSSEEEELLRQLDSTVSPKSSRKSKASKLFDKVKI